jgi:type IV pilus assembly protein PilB
VEEVLKRTTLTKEALPSYLVHPDIELYEDRDVIIREGTHDIDFFQLVQGSVMVVKNGKKIAEIVEPGEYFGEAAVVTGEARSASIVSKGRSRIKRFPGDKLPEIMEKYPDVAKQLFEETSKRLQNSNLKVVKLLNDIKQRS